MKVKSIFLLFILLEIVLCSCSSDWAAYHYDEDDFFYLVPNEQLAIKRTEIKADIENSEGKLIADITEKYIIENVSDTAQSLSLYYCEGYKKNGSVKFQIDGEPASPEYKVIELKGNWGTYFSDLQEQLDKQLTEFYWSSYLNVIPVTIGEKSSITLQVQHQRRLHRLQPHPNMLYRPIKQHFQWNILFESMCVSEKIGPIQVSVQFPKEFNLVSSTIAPSVLKEDSASYSFLRLPDKNLTIEFEKNHKRFFKTTLYYVFFLILVIIFLKVKKFI